MSMVMNMLDNAIDKLQDQHDLILHSDQGWQYQMKKYQHKLVANGIKQSMSRITINLQIQSIPTFVLRK